VITTLAVSMIFANLVGLGWGARSRSRRPRRSARKPSNSRREHQPLQIAVMVITVVLVLGVEAFYGTRSGKAYWRWPRIATRPCCAASTPTGCRAGRSSWAAASRR
jgi:branched-subunit amino acid ABC-type transport system permease component